jgi:hypothetical protein
MAALTTGRRDMSDAAKSPATQHPRESRALYSTRERIDKATPIRISIR